MKTPKITAHAAKITNVMKLNKKANEDNTENWGFRYAAWIGLVESKSEADYPLILEVITARFCHY